MTDPEATVVLAEVTQPETPPAGQFLAWLLVIRSEDAGMEGQLLELRAGETTLGRRGPASRSGAAFLFEDAFMSDPHVLLSRTGKRGPLRLRERAGLSTNNGTFINDRRLAPREEIDVFDGDRIRLGTTELVVKTLWLHGV
jgi:pSer/pThr/pTyr-binding forkhead associated (FHA) protein